MPNIEENKRIFLELCSMIKRDGIEDLLAWLESSDFFTAPASIRFHGNYPGGLVEHSLNVYYELDRLLGAYPEIQVSEETALISSLFHDLCKVNVYGTELRNRKNEEGVWEKYEAYTFNEKFRYGGHGPKSVFIVQNFMKLKPEEAVAINCHMGGFSEDPKSVCSAFEHFPFAWLVSVADQSATYLIESEKE